MTREDLILLLDAAMCLEIVAFHNRAGEEVLSDLRDVKHNLTKLLEE